MIRSILTLALALAFATQASAQTTPATNAAARKTTLPKAARPNTSASPAPTETGDRAKIGAGGNGAVGTTDSSDGRGQSIYAAPGMPVNIDNPKKAQGYDGPAPTRTKSRTTLTPR